MNMSYCRFQNTSQDLADCLNEVEHMNSGSVADMSHSERSALRTLLEQAEELAEYASEIREHLDNKLSEKYLK